jgi:DNA-binding NtrC family response regulator
VVERPSETHDVTLALEAFDADVLATCAHVHPSVSERRLRAAARESGGLPGRFLVSLRGPGSGRGSDLRVAEAHPAYETAEPSREPELEHPWRDLIAGAGRLAWTGRRSAAERDLRQIASAAERRQIELAAATAEVELAHLLLARGRTSEARELFATRTQRAGGSHHLATRAAMGLGFAHLLLGEFDAAESTFRVCRGAAPTGAAIGLAWTLLAQGRDVEAERAVAPARESPDAGARATAAAVTAAIALLRRDLPATARAAAAAHAGPGTPVTEAIASVLLVLVHARITDEAGIEQHRRRALAAARAARQPLLVIAARAAATEARHSLGLWTPRADLHRLLRLTDHVPPLLRAWLWLVLSRAHPVEPRRRDLSQRLEAFARTAGARGVPSLLAEPANAAAATDAATLVRIYESSAAPAETLKRVTEWLRDRVNARSVVIADAAAAPLARSGPHDSIGAVHRILQTRLGQAPWPSAEGLESGVLVRDANSVQGVIACRWPLSRAVSEDVLVLLTAAASVVGPAIALLAERSRNSPPSGDGIVGRSAAVARLRELVTRAAAAPFPVLVEGESGAGKELVARAIHRESPRRVRASVAVNCAAISDDLFEAEVFGHARGAFTGAHIERAGLFEQADGGTLFLDEISELSTRAQAKLLRVLQEGEVRRLGESHCRRVDVRLVAASNKRLDDEAAAGRFRADLLFRLAVIRIDVPPLRARREDIPLLVSHYWGLAAERTGTRAVLSATAVARLAEYDWPGNVRELQNVMAALAVQVPRGRVKEEHVAGIVRRPGSDEEATPTPERTLDAARRAFERQFIAAAIARSGGRHGAAARQLGISRQGLAKLLKRLDIG